jgi:hypothetical protein
VRDSLGQLAAAENGFRRQRGASLQQEEIEPLAQRIELVLRLANRFSRSRA